MGFGEAIQPIVGEMAVDSEEFIWPLTAHFFFSYCWGSIYLTHQIGVWWGAVFVTDHATMKQAVLGYMVAIAVRSPMRVYVCIQHLYFTLDVRLNNLLTNVLLITINIISV